MRLRFKKVSFLRALVNNPVIQQISTCSNFATLWMKHQVEHRALTFKRFNKQAKLDFVDLKNKLSNLCTEGGGSMTWRWCKDWWSIRTYLERRGWGVGFAIRHSIGNTEMLFTSAGRVRWWFVRSILGYWTASSVRTEKISHNILNLSRLETGRRKS